MSKKAESCMDCGTPEWSSDVRGKECDVTPAKHAFVSSATKTTLQRSKSFPEIKTSSNVDPSLVLKAHSNNDLSRTSLRDSLKPLERTSVGTVLKPDLANRRNAIDFSPVDAASDDVFEDAKADSSFEDDEISTESEYNSSSLEEAPILSCDERYSTPTECRKLPDEMMSYYTFLQCCTSLQNVSDIRQNPSPACSLRDSLESLTYPSALTTSSEVSACKLSQPLTCCYAYMHGGRDVSEAPVLCLPHYPTLRSVSDEEFNNVILYLTSTVSACLADVGFVVLVDRRKDKWPALRSTLQRIACYFPGFLRMVLVLRPIGFLQGAMSDIGFRWQRDELSLKVPVTMLSSLDELHNYVNPSQLTAEFGGSFEYDHHTWLKNRMMIENFTCDAVNLSDSLIAYGTELAETEMPNDISSTESLLHVQESKTQSLKNEIENLLKEAVALRINITSTCGGSIIADALNNELDFTKSSHMDVIKSFLSLIEETDMAFERFWDKHHIKLKQCLQLRQFEQQYRDLGSTFKTHHHWIEEQTQNVGCSLDWIEAMMAELETKKQNLKNLLNHNATVIASAEELLSVEHYAVDSIGPKKDELQTIASQLLESFAHREKCLQQSLEFVVERNKWSDWCDQGMSLLAGQILEKTTTVDGAEHALTGLDHFFKEKSSTPYSGKGKEEVQMEYAAAWCPELETQFESLSNRFKEVIQLYEKRKSSLKKVTTRHGDRPVQLVEPSKKHAKEVEVSSRHNQKPTIHDEKQAKRNSLTLNHAPLPKQTNETTVISSLPHHESPTVKQQHVMNELLHTEKVYVSELESIVEGYGKTIEAESSDFPVPDELKGKTNVLLGNMEDIYNFHGKVFVTELEEMKETPSKIGKCFLKERDNFHIYRDYCQNSIKSEQLRNQVGDQHPFFLHCQKKLGHRLSLGAYLLKPIQRLTKYQLLLQQMLKHTTSKDSAELKLAIQAMLEILKSVNDSMHQIAIVGFQRDITALGKLLMQGSFSVQVDHKKAGVKSLTRPRFSKAMQRHLFLYEKEFLFCKQQSADSLDGDSANAVPAANVHQPNGIKGQVYLFKHSLQMNAVGVTENIKGDPRRFEIWYHGREDVYTLTAPTAAVKQEWVKEVKRALANQPKSTTTPPEPHKPEKTSAKVKRTQSAKKSKPPQEKGDELTKTKSKTSSTSSAKESLKKKASSLTRSASMGKGKDRILKRKNTEVQQTTEQTPRNLPTEANPVVQDEQIPSPEELKPSIVVDNEFRPGYLKERPIISNEELDLRVANLTEVVVKTEWTSQKGDDSDTWTSSNHRTSVSDTSSFDSITSVDAPS